MYGISFICNLFDNDKNSVIEKLTDLGIPYGYIKVLYKW